MKYPILTLALALLFASCIGGRYVSADADLEAIYVGRSYYDIVGEFGNPDATLMGAMGGSKVAYNAVTLTGTSAAELYQRYDMRNRATHASGTPRGGITFYFDENNKCFAVDSDFQHQRVADPVAVAVDPLDPNAPVPVKPAVPRTLDYPYVTERSPNADAVSVEKIEVLKDKTVIHFLYSVRTPDRRPVNDYGISVNPDIYIMDRASLTRCRLLDHEGIALYPEHSQFAHNRGGYDILAYSLTFEALPENTLYIDIVEPGPAGRNYYRVDVRTPITTKEEHQRKNQ